MTIAVDLGRKATKQTTGQQTGTHTDIHSKTLQPSGGRNHWHQLSLYWPIQGILTLSRLETWLDVKGGSLQNDYSKLKIQFRSIAIFQI